MSFLQRIKVLITAIKQISFDYCGWREVVRFAVALPFAKVTIPARMDDNPFHSDVLLTAFLHKQVILAHHHTVCTSMTNEGKQETSKLWA